MPWQGKKGFGAPRSVSCGFDKQVDKNVKCNYRPQRGRDSPGFASLEKCFPLMGLLLLHLTGGYWCQQAGPLEGLQWGQLPTRDLLVLPNSNVHL